MHELSVAQSILEIVQQHVPEPQAWAVQAVRVRVGRLAGVVTDSLEFCFSAIITDTPWKTAKLDIEEIPTVCLCSDCAGRFAVTDGAFRCPSCGGVNVQLISGTELQVVEIDLAD